MDNPIVGRGWRFPPELDERGTVALIGNEGEIEQAIRIILGTVQGQRVMRPAFGCRIHELVFAPSNASTFGQATSFVQEALARWEPRINLHNVDVEPDPADASRLLISIDYSISALHSRRSLVYPFYLIPEETAAEVLSES